jgi:hypothetical protein
MVDTELAYVSNKSDLIVLDDQISSVLDENQKLKAKLHYKIRYTIWINGAGCGNNAETAITFDMFIGDIVPNYNNLTTVEGKSQTGPY